jgi:hypothetical protein
MQNIALAKSLKPIAAVDQPPTKDKNRNGCSYRPPKRQNDISSETKDGDRKPEHLSFHAPSLPVPTFARPRLPCASDERELDPIIRRVGQILFRAKVALSCLDWGMAEQQLDLFKLPAGRAAHLRATAPEVMGGNSRNSRSHRIRPEQLPDNFLAHPRPANLIAAMHRSE